MIELINVTYEVEEMGQKKKILDDVSCVFADDCFVAITGHNGSGKSTLTKLIVGIVKPTCGKIILNGKDITNLSVLQIFAMTFFVKSIFCSALLQFYGNNRRFRLVIEHISHSHTKN